MGISSITLLALAAGIAFVAGSLVGRYEHTTDHARSHTTDTLALRRGAAPPPSLERPTTWFSFVPRDVSTPQPLPGRDTAGTSRDFVQVAVQDGPTFSPSFGSSQRTLFFHAEAAQGTRLMKAVTDPQGKPMEMAVLLTDHARNYHVRVSPDGNELAFDSDRDGDRGVYVMPSGGGVAARVSGPGYAAVPSWSADGERLAFTRAEPNRPRVWNLWSADLSTREQHRLTNFRVGQVWPGNWFKDGRRLVYTHETDLWLLDVVSGTQRRYKTPIPKRLLRTATASTDGTRVAFQVYRDGLWVLDLRTGRMSRWLADPSAEEFAWSPDDSRLAFHSHRGGSWSVWTMRVPTS